LFSLLLVSLDRGLYALFFIFYFIPLLYFFISICALNIFVYLISVFQTLD